MAKKKSKKLKIIPHEQIPFKDVEEDGVAYRVFGNERITVENISDAGSAYGKVFGANKNLYRITPSLIDGMRPGKRRLLWSWWEADRRPMGMDADQLRKRKEYKVNIVSSKAMEYHPHGDSAQQELVGREAQYWSNNVLLVDGDGSYGNLQNADPAAGRYITAKLSEYTIDCFFDDFNSYCVPMKPSYDGEHMEPEYFPAKYPHILFNPQISGIGYGLATNIPSYNVGEVLDATVKLIKNPKEKIMLIPDIPTGADVIDNGQFKAFMKSGKGKMGLQASSEIDYKKNTIRFTTLPLQIKSADIIKNVLKLKREDKKGLFSEITDINDRTQEGEVDLTFVLRSDANPDKVLKQLYEKGTGLRNNFSVAITVVDGFVSYELGVKDLLLDWIEYRRDCVRSMFLNKLRIASEREIMVKVLLMVSSKENSETTLDIARKAQSKKEYAEKLIKKFGINSLQAGTITEMKTHQFNKDAHERYEKEEQDLQNTIKDLETKLNDEDNIDKFIIEQLLDGKKKYAEPRKSKVVKLEDSTKKVPDTEHLVGISDNGFVKKISLKGNSSIGPVGKGPGRLSVMQINNRSDILAVDSLGMVAKIPVSALPDMAFDEEGVELTRYFKIKGKLVTSMELPSMKLLEVESDNICILFITKRGVAKKVPLSEFKNITDVKQGITLNPGDEVASAIFVFDNTSKDIVISTNFGDGIRLKMDDIKTMSRKSKGNPMITLKDGEEVVNACRIDPKKKLLFYITTAGRVKLTEAKYFPVMTRKDEAISLIKLEGKERLLGVASVTKKDVVMVYRRNGDPEKLPLADLEIGTRVSKGEKRVKTPKGDTVIAYKVFTAK